MRRQMASAVFYADPHVSAQAFTHMHMHTHILESKHSVCMDNTHTHTHSLTDTLTHKHSLSLSLSSACLVVAGDNDDANLGLAAHFDGIAYFGARRIQHASQA
jgi:hypothetical protein